MRIQEYEVIYDMSILMWFYNFFRMHTLFLFLLYRLIYVWCYTLFQNINIQLHTLSHNINTGIPTFICQISIWKSFPRHKSKNALIEQERLQ